MFGILLQHLFLCYMQQLSTVDNGIFLYGWCEYHFVSELNNEYFTTQVFKNILVVKSYVAVCNFKTVLWVDMSYTAVCFNYFLSIAIFRT